MTARRNARRREDIENWTPRGIGDLSDALVVITGANSGLGFVVAQECAARGAAVTLAVRSVAKGADAKNSPVSLSGSSWPESTESQTRGHKPSMHGDPPQISKKSQSGRRPASNTQYMPAYRTTGICPAVAPNRLRSAVGHTSHSGPRARSGWR